MCTPACLQARLHLVNFYFHRMKRYIKFMVTLRSIEKVEKELQRLGIPITEIDYGIVRFPEKLNAHQSLQLNLHLPELGFEVLDTFETDLLDQASLLIKEFVYDKPQLAISDYPTYLEKMLACAEPEIDKIFSQVLGISICQCARIQQVERMKELILYENLDLHQLADIFYFGDETAVTQVFQHITGLAPAFLKKIKNKRSGIRQRSGLDLISNRICFQAINIAN